MSGLTVNRNELAEICGVALPTISDWCRKGMPYVQKPDLSKGAPPHLRVWQFNTAAVIRWLRDEAYQSGQWR